MQSYIKGVFKKLIFSSSDGFIVGLINIKETNDQDALDYVGKLFTFRGLFAGLNIDDEYLLKGEVLDDPKYGIQYKVDSYEKVLPSDKDGVVAFLSSDIFKGIGEKSATEIVNTLGDGALNKIKEDYTCLKSVPKMTDKKALEIHSALLKYNESFETVVFLTSFGFSMKDALKIYNHYKEDTKRVLLDDPYELIDTVDDISFLKIDALRKKTNIKDNDEKRINALIIYVAGLLCFQNGDTYFTKDEIYNAFKSVYENTMQESDFNYYLMRLNELGKVIIDNDKYALSTYYKDEDYIANAVYFLSNKDDEKVKDIDKKIENLEYLMGITYNEEQKKAVKQAITKNFSIITGGPGTGKTTIIRGITELYKMTCNYSALELNEKLVLLAPTGRAAKRMSEACNYPASTIHRYLKWNKETNKFQYDERNKVNAEFVIVDETSMIDTNLLASFFKAMPSNVKLVFIGDYNQLESVSPGKVLKDLIDSEMLNTIFLKEIYRQDENSYITELALEVNEGELSESFLEKKDDYNFIKCDEQDVLKATCEVCMKALEKGYDVKSVQVLAPMYKGINGIDNLNKVLQAIFNPKSDAKNEVQDGFVTYRENDKILQLENMPDSNVYNGDIGFIESIENGIITIDFYGNKVKYHKKDYKMIKHGYAISIHKAQGSEFDIVIMPVTHSYRVMLYRKLVYTGITRAKKSLILIGDPKSFGMAVYNKGNKERKTQLKKMLIKNVCSI